MAAGFGFIGERVKNLMDKRNEMINDQSGCAVFVLVMADRIRKIARGPGCIGF